MAGNETVDHGRRHLLHLAGGGLGLAVLGTGPAHAWAQTTPAAPLKIGSVGAGRMGGALGALFITAGSPVMFSSRHPENLKEMAARLGPLAQAGPVEQAIAFGDVVVMVVPYAALEEIGKTHGRALASKPLVLDICNPIARRRRGGHRAVGQRAGRGRAGQRHAVARGAHRARVQRDQLSEAGHDAHRPGGLSASRSPATISRPSPSPKASPHDRLRAGARRRPREGQIPAPRHTAGQEPRRGDSKDRRRAAVTVFRPQIARHTRALEEGVSQVLITCSIARS